MTRLKNTTSPVDRVTETLDDQTTEAFKILGNETRLAILLAFWEEVDPDQPPVEQSALSFSELRDRVGVADSGQFNYHLDKLTGVFLEQDGEKYRPTSPSGILAPLMTNPLKDVESFDNVPIDAECGRCGSSTVIDYTDHRLIERCRNCAGSLETNQAPAGSIASYHIWPGPLENLSPREFHRHASTRFRLQLESVVEGICPKCAGTVTPNLHVCDNHIATEEAVCEHCGFSDEISWLFVCDVCKYTHWHDRWNPIIVDNVVQRFFDEHGLDLHSLFDTGKRVPIYSAIKNVELVSSDPPEVVVTVELDGDRLEVTLDETAHRSDVKEIPG